MSMSSHQKNGGHDEWLTPPGILAALGAFDLDPCAPITRPWPTAAQHYTVQDGGLDQQWSGRVWCNPPFGREAIKWMRRMADHGDGIALIPARTETAMFYETVWPRASAVLFIKGRPHFHYVDGRRAPFNSGAPICLVAYGSANALALERSDLGRVLHLAPPDWISVAERTPPEGEYVLVWEKWSTHPFVGEFSLGSWGVSTEHYDCAAGWDGGVVVAKVNADLVTHWMPLPAPPET